MISVPFAAAKTSRSNVEPSVQLQGLHYPFPDI